MTWDLDLRNRAVEVYKAAPHGGKDAVAKTFGVSLKSLRRWEICYEAEGSLAPKRVRSSTGVGVSDEVFVCVRHIFLLEPRLTWEEAADELFARMALLKTGRQIMMACNSRGYTRHKLQTAAIERDEQLRAKFREVMDSGAFCSSQLVAVDETLKKGHDALRDKGVAPRGERAYGRTTGALLGQRASALCALTLSVIIACEIVDTKETNVNSDMFIAFLKSSVLPQMNAFPARDSVLLLDNCRIHDRIRIYTICHVIRS